MNFFANMKIGKRLGLGFALILLFMMVLLVISIWQISKVATTTENILKTPLTKERVVSDWYRTIRTSVIRTTAIAKSTDSNLSAFFANDATAASKVSTELQKTLEGLLSSDEEKKLFNELSITRKKYIIARDAIAKAKVDGQVDEANQMLEKDFTPAAKSYLDLLQQLLDMQRTTINQMADSVQQIEDQSRNILISLGSVLFVLGWLLAWRLAVGITRPLSQAVDIAETIASGDLTSHIESGARDETGQLLRSLQAMNDNLLKIVSQVRAGTDTIANASAEIATGNLDLSNRTEQQAGSLEETASTIEELTATVRHNAESARQANQLAVSASDIAVQGGMVVDQVVERMGSINESSKKIVDIISVIDSIAFQTNILALNAAVEAARAGEQGRGFAVVASEVRNLAQRSASAAKEIKTLIDDSVEKVDNGSKLVEKAGATMVEIVASVKRVVTIVGEITLAGQEQSSGIQQVNDAIVQMDEATQQNAALVEQAAAAAQSLQDQAANLANVVHQFKLNDNQQLRLIN
ncbi:methyl-accepting chemotaxis protein [Undibacterium sp. RTI2.1]|uniref:methyl-accepting chemotaxis protein n=1 Tax=unclassified Undibacterium TaxID=2630295 RepID=UPI002AB4A666|nr:MULTISPECIES: methyl-accepting chemotaxis protein [unclassified Undibacterium]MDY7538462.1 methyl-accepting chemotaxis protein [Undibacterium sp. 5I1]MEB0030011.1 methyl-accepting chemotaxis protein [Undibacterium sp. RTI2.1]MEB0114914.1 methyl-accepting chemotaxis protein [Undibacterium sp. RTI2.2]MEB0230636.1 methyl-accepting chemotaxis protein [Undibacterium sp. 10I3]MEB0255873.1 methyl-accepting chemotaxis protein [Undibacterium sp. 5I1]